MLTTLLVVVSSTSFVTIACGCDDEGVNDITTPEQFTSMILAKNTALLASAQSTLCAVCDEPVDQHEHVSFCFFISYFIHVVPFRSRQATTLPIDYDSVYHEMKRPMN